MTKYESDRKTAEKIREEIILTDGDATVTREEYKTVKNGQIYNLVWYVVRISGKYHGASKGITQAKGQVERIKNPTPRKNRKRYDVGVRQWQKEFKARPELRKAMGILRRMDRNTINQIISYAKSMESE